VDALDLALHGLNFLAPAWFLAGAMALGAHFWPRRWLRTTRLPWGWHVFVLGVLGSGVLVGGLWWLGVDGKMATYGALVLVLASAQWVLSRSWRG
jgi:hypothetical protein